LLAALRLTGVTTPLPLLIGEVEAMEKNSCGRSTVFGAVWYAHSAAENWSFDSGSVRVILSTKNRCVVTPDVRRHARPASLTAVRFTRHTGGALKNKRM